MDADTGIGSTVEQEREIVLERLPGYRNELNAVTAKIALAADGASCAVFRKRKVRGVGPRDSVGACAVRATATDAHVSAVAKTLVRLVQLLCGDAVWNG